MQLSNSFINSSNQSHFNGSLPKWSGYIVLPSWLTSLQLILQLSIALFGIAGNVLVCITVTRRRTMRAATYFYLRSLAVADIGVLAINFPLAVIKSHSLWPFGEAFCLYIYPITDVFFGASIWSITVIAIERRRCTSKRTGHKTRRSDQRRPESFVRWVLVLVWCMSLVATAVPTFLVTRYSRHHKLCYPQWPSVNDKQPSVYKQAYILSLLLFWYVLPLALIIVTTTEIAQQLNISSSFHRAMESECHASSRQAHTCRFFQEERRKLKQNNKAKKLLTPIVALFCISMLPFHTFHLTALYYAEFIHWKYYMVMFNIVILFAISNSALDPLVYCLVSREFRRGFRSALTSGCGKVRSVSAPARQPQRLMGNHGIPGSNQADQRELKSRMRKVRE